MGIEWEVSYISIQFAQLTIGNPIFKYISVAWCAYSSPYPFNRTILSIFAVSLVGQSLLPCEVHLRVYGGCSLESICWPHCRESLNVLWDWQGEIGMLGSGGHICIDFECVMRLHDGIEFLAVVYFAKGSGWDQNGVDGFGGGMWWSHKSIWWKMGQLQDEAYWKCMRILSYSNGTPCEMNLLDMKWLNLSHMLHHTNFSSGFVLILDLVGFSLCITYTVWAQEKLSQWCLVHLWIWPS